MAADTLIQTMLRQSTKQQHLDKPERAQETLSVDIPKGVPKEILVVCRRRMRSYRREC